MSMRSAASVIQPRAVRSAPRGARIVRVGSMRGSWVMLELLPAGFSIIYRRRKPYVRNPRRPENRCSVC